MRRMILLLLGLGTGGALLFTLCIGAAAQYTLLRVPQTPTEPESSLLNLPCPVEDTGLVASCLASYDGPYLEDGSDDEVIGVAALVIENVSDLLISRGAVILLQKDRHLVFEFTALPPGASVLVLEKSRQLYYAESPEACWGWAQKEYPENTGAVTVWESGSKSLNIRNMSGCALKGVVVLFKNFDAESGMYIGGISYPVCAEHLAAGEERTVSPFKYVRNYSRVVYLSVTIE